MIETQIRNALWYSRDATRALRCISDGFDDELGSIDEFLDEPAKRLEAKRLETTQKGESP